MLMLVYQMEEYVFAVLNQLGLVHWNPCTWPGRPGSFQHPKHSLVVVTCCNPIPKIQPSYQKATITFHDGLSSNLLG